MRSKRRQMNINATAARAGVFVLRSNGERGERVVSVHPTLAEAQTEAEELTVLSGREPGGCASQYVAVAGTFRVVGSRIVMTSVRK